MSQRAIPCSLIRGGTSKGLYFLEQDLPADTEVRDRVLLAAMGSPDERQVDGVGGAHPLTSKVAIVGPSSRDDAEIDYLFVQVNVDKPRCLPPKIAATSSQVWRLLLLSAGWLWHRNPKQL